MNAFLVSSMDTLAPSWKPNNALTPLSLKMSALPIPPAKALCICSAVVLKSSPVTAATLPVICKTSANSLASSATTAKLPDADAMSCKLNGTRPANSVNTSNALPPSSALPNKFCNRSSSVSISLPILTMLDMALPTPIAAMAPPAAKATLRMLVMPVLTDLMLRFTLPNAPAVLSVAVIVMFWLATNVFLCSLLFYCRRFSC